MCIRYLAVLLDETPETDRGPPLPVDDCRSPLQAQVVSFQPPHTCRAPHRFTHNSHPAHSHPTH